MTCVHLWQPPVLLHEPKCSDSDCSLVPPGSSCLVKIPNMKVILNSVPDWDFQYGGRIQVALCWFPSPRWRIGGTTLFLQMSYCHLHHIPLPGENLNPSTCQQVLGRRWEQIGNHVISNFTSLWNRLLQRLTVYTVDITESISELPELVRERVGKSSQKNDLNMVAKWPCEEGCLWEGRKVDVKAQKAESM